MLPSALRSTGGKKARFGGLFSGVLKLNGHGFMGMQIAYELDCFSQ